VGLVAGATTDYAAAMKRACITAVAAVAAIAGCDRSKPRADVDPDRIARGRAVSAELKQALMRRLTAAMNDGPAAAVRVCSDEAPKIAASLSRDGVVVGRATRRPRNPNNAAIGWRDAAIARFEALAADGALAATSYHAERRDGIVAYAEPLLIQEPCLRCHGTAIAPDVAAVLAERYPADRATGYALGDLRGIVWVELPN
jgi:hypothetical protein